MYKLTLIARYLLKRRITYFATLAVAMCVFIVVVVMTVMTGLVGDFKEKNHAFVGDCVVGTDSLVGFPYYEEFIRLVEQAGIAVGVSPVVKAYALLNTENGFPDDDVEIVGLDPVRHSQATNWGRTLYFRTQNVAKAFLPLYDESAPGCVVGIDKVLPRNAQSQYVQFDSPHRAPVTLTCFPLNAKGALSGPAGIAKTKRFYYSDNSRTGLARVDDAYVYIPLADAQVLCMEGQEKRVTAIHIKFRAGVGVEAGRRRVAELWEQFQDAQATAKAAAPDRGLLNTVTVQTWKEYRRAVIAPVETEQVMLSCMFVLVGITTVFIVSVVFYMIVRNKRKDIGVLKSVGASNASVLLLFQGFAFGIGLIGSSAGALFAWLFLSKINRVEQWCYENFGVQLWDRTIYVIEDIPHHLEFPVLAVILSSAILACLMGALIPSYLAARLRPVEILHAARL
ncbi:MAG: FtsX-like permease family protein [Planctomycetes bacterium]|jgi:lipoprotein-releasing system permease protein|nr:FtsX-like permease family protein [Planctomycetota bacterium]